MRWAISAVLAAAGALALAFASAALALVAGGLLLAAAALIAGLTVGAERRQKLEDEIHARSSELGRALSELEVAQAETVRRLSMAVEFRDEDTGAHIERIGRFSTMLAQRIGMDEEYCARLGHAAPLHDVGKVAIPDAILLKPGPLTPDERAIVETHTEEGHRLLSGSSSSILDLAATIALSHHEKWDGSGYPRGMAGESIPIEGRIVAIADVFDALTSDRVYRKAFSVEQAVEMMLAQRGRHFDQVLLDAFMEVLDTAGPDARGSATHDSTALVQSVLDSYVQAIKQGDAETAEGAIMRAIEDGVEPLALHSEVFAPALSRIESLALTGEMDSDGERLAIGITRRILASLYRYMLGATERNRERILLGAAEGERPALELQMVHDQLALAGYQTTIAPTLTLADLTAAVNSDSPDAVVLAINGDVGAVEPALRELRDGGHETPVVLWAGNRAAPKLPSDLTATKTLDRIERSVPAVEDLLARVHAVS
ncbi:MAG TPA: HD domain-containing phosphohydrolase [Solirubrobacteraceae bacterium]